MIFPTDRSAPLLTSVSEPKSLNYTGECTHPTSPPARPIKPLTLAEPPRERQPSLAPQPPPPPASRDVERQQS